MKVALDQQKCGNCYFGREKNGILTCRARPPGAAVPFAGSDIWRTVEDADWCGAWAEAGKPLASIPTREPEKA